jgi:RNA polymerase sigma-70 factor (ECF subfamily)
VPTAANGAPAFGQWRPSGPNGSYEPFAVHAMELSASGISGIYFFVEPSLFPFFGLPVQLEW